MQDELNQFEKKEVWDLVQSPKYKHIISTKWVFNNKIDENGIIIINKARLVSQFYNVEEETDFDETFPPVARLETIRLLLAYDCSLNFSCAIWMLKMHPWMVTFLKKFM